MSKRKIICYGEVLWDILPSGKTPGGAPMNVAFHLQQLGSSSRVISRVGNDTLGNELIQFLNKKGIDTKMIQLDTSLPTGTVNVKLDKDGTPAYKIVEDVAWDNIQISQEWFNKVKETDAVIFGSLACRTAQSQLSLFKLLEVVTLRIFDINLRPPFYSKTLLEKLLHQADIVKMNEEELEIVVKWIGDFDDEIKKIKAVKEKYHIDIILVTKGKAGVICMDNDTVFRHPIFPIVVADTVGSGDAFLAGFVHQFLQGKGTEECLELASAMGAFVATKSGATPILNIEELKKIQHRR